MSVQPVKRGMDVSLIVFAGVLSVSLALNVRLGLKAKALPPVFAELGFKVGSRLPDLNVSDTAGGNQKLAFSRPSLVYVFSPTCEWSKADYRNLLAIANASKANYDIVGLVAVPGPTEGELSAYLAPRPFPGRVVRVDVEQNKLSEELVRSLFVTPQLLVVERDGRIRRAWSGALLDVRERDAETYFGIDLPGAPMVGGMAEDVGLGNPIAVQK